MRAIPRHKSSLHGKSSCEQRSLPMMERLPDNLATNFEFTEHEEMSSFQQCSDSLFASNSHNVCTRFRLAYLHGIP